MSCGSSPGAAVPSCRVSGSPSGEGRSGVLRGTLRKGEFSAIIAEGKMQGGGAGVILPG